MGYYIEVPKDLHKAFQIINIYGAKKLMAPPKTLSEIPSDQALICVVENGPFDAAAYCYNDGELKDFSYQDGRMKTWLTLDKKLVEKLTDFKG
jgi:hypothetical protein